MPMSLQNCGLNLANHFMSLKTKPNTGSYFTADCENIISKLFRQDT